MKKYFPGLKKKKNTWKELENASLTPVSLNGNSYSPFDIDGINNYLVNNGFVYGAGYALFMKPSFFIGTINRFEKLMDIMFMLLIKKFCGIFSHLLE